LDILGQRGIKASIFFSMGPDNSGKAIRRIFRKGFISKMLRTRAPSTYGLKTLFYGTLLTAPMIVSSNPDILKRAVDEGHDCGIHCWDHVLWQDRLPKMPREEIRGELSKAVSLFSQVTGVLPKSSAAPGWQVSFDSLTVQDELEFDYCSDIRGVKPFYPRMNGVGFRTLQIPSTLPTLDELWGTKGMMDAETVNDKYLDLLEPGLNVHTLHAEMEGGSQNGTFARFLDCCIAGETEFLTLRDAASRFKNSGPADVEMWAIPGRAGKVAVQKAS
jgi:peptidoglycan/xylan/chitin deacetylase (PgdA/CDA1 family)